MMTSKVTYFFPSGQIIGRLSKGIGRSRSLEGPRYQTAGMAPSSSSSCCCCCCYFSCSYYSWSSYSSSSSPEACTSGTASSSSSSDEAEAIGEGDLTRAPS